MITPATTTIRSERSEKTKEEMMRLSLVETQSGAHVSGGESVEILLTYCYYTHRFVFQLGFPLPPTTPEITTLEHTTPPQTEP